MPICLQVQNSGIDCAPDLFFNNSRMKSFMQMLLASFGVLTLMLAGCSTTEEVVEEEEEMEEEEVVEEEEMTEEESSEETSEEDAEMEDAE